MRMKARSAWVFVFISHSFPGNIEANFKNDWGKMNTYRKGGDKKKMITEDIVALAIIILIISFLLMIRRY